jgi:hypothetical protein
MMQARLSFIWLGIAALTAACPSTGPTVGSVCTAGKYRCDENSLQVCADDGESYIAREDCTLDDKVCLVGEGCLKCYPNSRRCGGFAIARCSPDGSRWDVIATCDSELGDVCFGGSCINACELADQSRSYEGCEYFAVDLDNAVIADQGAAAAQQFSVVLSNASQILAQVSVEIFCTAADAANPAIACAEGSAHILDSFPLAPGGLEIVDLDPREVDGSSSPELNDGPGTFRSRAAYRIGSTAPLIAYQFNPLENVSVFSNDASLLLPTSALGSRYLALSWPQTLATTDDANTNGRIDLRAFLTIVGVHDETYVTVKLSTDILGGSDIPASKAGDTISFPLDRFEVVNLETDGFNADFTSTSISSDDETKPVIVFTGSEASDSPRFETFLERSCCADHMEQQLFPEVALGTQFVAVKTPLRSTYVDGAGWDVSIVPDEPEFWRVLATREDTSISTNLPPPNNSFFLQRGDSVIFETERDFVMQASHPISFGQFPGGQQTTGIPSTLPGGLRPPGGDPSFILVPPVQQWRDSYLFLVPNKYAFDFLLLAVPADAVIFYDGLLLETVLECEYEPIGTLSDGEVDTEYQAIRCPLSLPNPAGPGLQDDGVHTLTSASGEAFGLVVWGFDSYVSYGYPGGANVALINIE